MSHAPTSDIIPHSTNIKLPTTVIHRASLPICPALGLNLESGEGALLSLLVPLLGPNARADGDGHLSHVLASVLVALGRLEAEEPLVVSVPAVVGLVLGGESRVSGRRADVLDDVEPGGILGRQLRHGFGEDFVDLGHVCANYFRRDPTEPTDKYRCSSYDTKWTIQI